MALAFISKATAEYLAEFRTDLEGFVALEVVEACVGGYREQQPAADNSYRRYARARCEEERIGVRSPAAGRTRR
jgi:hypothetical protein